MDWYSPLELAHDPMYIMAWTFGPDNPKLWKSEYQNDEEFQASMDEWRERRKKFWVKMYGEDRADEIPSEYQTAWTLRRILSTIDRKTMKAAISHMESLRARADKGEEFNLDFADNQAFRIMKMRWLWEWWKDANTGWQPGIGPQKGEFSL